MVNDRRSIAIRQGMAYVLAAFAVVCVVSHCACAPSASAKSQAADAAYALEHQRCVASYETNAEIDDCRDRVRTRWGITTKVRDAGSDR